jgi:hypothetical protein
MTARNIAGRIARLEQYRRPRSSYVLHLSKPPTSEELVAIEKAKAEGRRFAILPRISASVEEWLANYAPREDPAMIARNIESRIVKLEARRARPDEMLVVWRKPDGNVAAALEGVMFAKGDKVICAEWFDSSPPPAPRWYGDQLRRAMTPAEYEQINRTIDRVAERPEANRVADGFAPFPSIPQDRMNTMTDNDLAHAILGVRT